MSRYERVLEEKLAKRRRKEKKLKDSKRLQQRFPEAESFQIEDKCRGKRRRNKRVNS